VETSEYSPAIEYIPGKLNVVADFFSRVDTSSMASAGDLAGELAAHARWEGDTCVISLSTTEGENCQSLSLCTVRAQEVPEGSDGADGRKLGGAAQPLIPQLSKPQQWVGTITVWQCKQQLTSTHSITWAASPTGPSNTQKIRMFNNAASLVTYATE
jgi:hypothetical protein